ncbi:MAG: GDSL-type esterase/lipase family protein [bacterium]|nr:GDSL-type esterase/lipase family protein [bacterium]
MMTRSYLILLLSWLLICTSSYACPAVNGYPDVNCDGKFVISFFGDSVTRGNSDPLITQSSGGVPIRVKKYFKANFPKPSFKVLNFGDSGIKCLNLKNDMRRFILENDKGVGESDVTIIACGLNDYWSHKNSSLTAAYLLSMRRFAKNHGIFATVAKVTQTRRPFQQPWVQDVNSKIKKLAKNIRYDQIDSLSMISSDRIHPNGLGYDFMFSIFLDYLNRSDFKNLAETQLKLHDTDSDGLYDIFEIDKFDTDPTLADTDSDGLTDYQEIFIYHLDPLLADSNGDGISDLDEVENQGANPTPSPTFSPSPSISPSPSPEISPSPSPSISPTPEISPSPSPSPEISPTP